MELNVVGKVLQCSGRSVSDIVVSGWEDLKFKTRSPESGDRGLPNDCACFLCQSNLLTIKNNATQPIVVSARRFEQKNGTVPLVNLEDIYRGSDGMAMGLVTATGNVVWFHEQDPQPFWADFLHLFDFLGKFPLAELGPGETTEFCILVASNCDCENASFDVSLCLDFDEPCGMAGTYDATTEDVESKFGSIAILDNPEVVPAHTSAIDEINSTQEGTTYCEENTADLGVEADVLRTKGLSETVLHGTDSSELEQSAGVPLPDCTFESQQTDEQSSLGVDDGVEVPGKMSDEGQKGSETEFSWDEIFSAPEWDSLDGHAS